MISDPGETVNCEKVFVVVVLNGGDVCEFIK